jgi:hypothetical protein
MLFLIAPTADTRVDKLTNKQTNRHKKRIDAWCRPLCCFVLDCGGGGGGTRAWIQISKWWQHLAWRAFSQNVCAFRLRPKLHYSYHMLERLTDTYENSSKADQKRYREREREGEGRGRGRERETGRGRHRECNMYTP